MKILVAILLFLAGLAFGWWGGKKTAGRKPYMPMLEEIERDVGPKLAAFPADGDSAKKRELCSRLRQLTDGLKANGAPQVLIDAAESDLKTHCSNP